MTLYYFKKRLWREDFFHSFFGMHMSYAEHHLPLMRWISVTVGAHFSPRMKTD